MANGEIKRVEQVKKGDILISRSGDIAVECVLRTDVEGGSMDLVSLEGGLTLTPWHPVYYRGQWMFPADITPPRLTKCEYIYSFVGTGDSVVIDGIPAVTLGHGIENDPVAAHPFFGSKDAIKRNLSQMKGWSSGQICVRAGALMRDPATSLVTSWDTSKAY